ncbi:hypothetical protein GCM10027570_40840 [Streptomonospora sediminis]
MAVGVLGPLEAAGPAGPLALKGPRQRAVLARLVIAAGRVVPLDRLVEDLWGAHPPEGAVAAIRTFVADLRRALEPDRAPRRPARLLVTAPPGYALRLAPGAVDARRFEAAVTDSAALLEAGRAGPALEELEQGLSLWRGPAYAEFADSAWARAEADRLEELRLLAVERRADALMQLGRAVEAAPDLQEQVSAHPLRENAWRLLALALYRAHRQGDALAALRRARRVLAAELGVDPGAELRRLEADILAQEPHLAAPHPQPAPAPAAADPPPAAAPAPPQGPGAAPFVGRDAELAQLERAAATAGAGRVTTALVSGGAGAGKTALARTLGERLAERGWTTAWGDNPEHDGAPPVWPWERIAAELAPRAVPAAGGTAPPEPAATTGSGADPAAARFRAQRRAAALVAAAAQRGPVLLVADDLHRAGEETLELLSALAGEPVPGPVLLVGTYRSDHIGPALAAALARLAPREPLRVYLEGLSHEATGELVAALADGRAEPATVRAIHRRSGGNPFYARELARLFADQGAAALQAVPPGVGDVIRHRLELLAPAPRRLLRQAAVIGRDIDPGVLAGLAGTGEDALEATEAAIEAGFLTEPEPHRLRFSHVLVRDAVYEGISGPRRARWHGAAAQAIERLRPDDAASLAHHFARADTPGAADKAAGYARSAARSAEDRFAPHEAARLWREALTAHDRAGSADERARLEAVMGMVRALAVTGRLEESRTHRGRAVAAAERLGDPELTAHVITAFDVPAVWPRNDDEDLSRRLAGAAERTLAALPAEATRQRARLLAALALELRGAAGDRGPDAARRAEAIARADGDPALLCLALNASFMQSFQRAGGARRRAGIGAELVETAAGSGLVAFEVLGRLVLLQAHSALADFAAADHHAAAAQRLGERYEIGHVGVFTRWYAALRTAAAGRVEAAETAYRTAGARLSGAQMPGMEEGIVPLALLCLRLQNGLPAQDAAQVAGADWGPYAPWVNPLVQDPGAADPPQPPPEAPWGLLNEALTCLGARTAVAAGDRAAMRRAYNRLLPAADELAGAGSGLLTLGPVAHYLGDLAQGLGRHAAAAEHYHQAARVAGRAQAPQWSTAAQQALAHAK